MVGASYGGYAALMGAVKTPKRYKCAISFAGVTDLNHLMRSELQYTHYKTAKESIGSKRKQLHNTSPINNIDHINVPILLIHGDSDRVVPVEHSRRMYNRLKSSKKGVTYLELEEGNHYLSNNHHRVTTFKTIDTFLSKYLPIEKHE